VKKKAGRGSKHIKKSFRFRLALVVVGLISFAITVCVVMNCFFLNSFYSKNRRDDLEKTFYTVKTIFEENNRGIISENDILTVASLCDKYGISLIIADPSVEKIYVHGDSTDILSSRLEEILINSSHNFIDGRIIKQNSDFTMVKVHDENADLDYLEIVATFNSNVIMLMRGALDVSSYATIANIFFSVVGVCVIIICAIIVSAVAYKLSYRLYRIVNISEKMTRMDFNVRYEGETGDEIDALGYNMNKLADELQKNISELKHANLELKKDIQKKNEIEETRTQFLSNVSHELKTPLAIIQGYAEGLKESVNDDSESRDFYCDVIIDEANKMNTMVRKLLTLNQIESGGGNIELERFNVVEVIKQRLNAVAIMLEQQDARVVLSCDEEVFVWADEFKIEEVITNYLSNAINHLGGEKVIKITVEKNENDIVRVTVFNSGNHIPEDDLEKIWDKFYKVDKARTREYGGSGIGLSIVKAIMNSHKQSCGVINVNGGVAFWFEMDGRTTV